MSTSALKTAVTGKPADKEQSPVVAFSGFLERFKPQMKMALPKHLTPDRMARLAVTAFSTNDKLQLCEPKSIVGSIMTAATLGLEIGVDGQGFLVPYGRTCQFVPGWKGLVDLVNRSGNGTVYTGVIFKDQEYTFTDGSRRELTIHNETDLDAPEDITHAYAIGWVKGASMPIIELWRVSKIKKHRDRYNKQGTKHYSFRDWEMYARKIPLLQVLKYMPKSIELQNAIALNDAAETGRHATLDGEFVTVTDMPLEDQVAASDAGNAGAQQQTAQAAQDGPSPYDVLFNRIKAAKDVDVLDLVTDEIRYLGDEEQEKKLYELAKERRTELGGD